MSERAGVHDSESFYDQHWTHTETAADPHVIAKGDRVLRMMPEDVHTVADVGCGDGYLTHRLAERYDVTAFDRSAVALRRLRVRAVQASADALPLPDRAVDLVFSSEMLEHLPDDLLARASQELARVANRYLFISVPYRETLRRRFARCPRCGLEFHVYGHLQSFDAPALDRLFPGFERIETELAGPIERPISASIERLRQRVFGRWFNWTGLTRTCPQCGETRSEPRSRSLLHAPAEMALGLVTTIWKWGTRRRPEPYWIMAVYRRRDAM